jgi:DNA-directed RNA polymerase specialized sigma subunit
MAKTSKDSEKCPQWEKDLECIKLLFVLLANKMGVEKKEIAKALGVSGGRVSQILNPKKYRKT